MTTFTNITVWRAFIPFRLSFKHNLADRSGTETLLVRLGTADGRVGYGQVLPRPYLTGETIMSALEDIRERWWPRLKAMELGPGPVLDVFLPLFMEADRERRTAGFAGIDVAMRMALGYYGAETSFVNRLGKDGRLELVGVIPAAGPRKASLLARTLRVLGYRRFKVKVGVNADADARRMEAVRQAVGRRAWLAADANGAWDWDEAARRMRGLGRRYGVVLVEEPLRKDSAVSADYRILEKRAGVEAMADESLCTTADAEELLERGSPSWWNIRLAKNGGFMGVNVLAGMARKAGVRLYGGILVGETGVLAEASRMAFYETAVECGEYGFSRVFLKGDPFRGSPAGYAGRYAAPEIGEAGVRLRKKGMPGAIVFSEGKEE